MNVSTGSIFFGLKCILSPAVTLRGLKILFKPVHVLIWQNTLQLATEKLVPRNVKVYWIGCIFAHAAP